MATPKFNSKSPTIRRILKEAAEITNSPSADYTAAPLDTDMFEWHFTFKGPPNSAYADGIYHGRIVLPPTYPLRPPSFRFTTPSGRFEVNREICLSISGHHEETWQPAWGVRTALVALRSFMETDPRGQLGGLDTSEAIRKRHAVASRTYQCPTCGKTNEEIINECTQASKANEGEAVKEVEVPSELKLGWKDEMGKPTENPSDNANIAESGKEDVERESAELAEGFVPTVPAPALAPAGTGTEMRQRVPTVGTAALTPNESSSNLAAQSIPEPTRTTPLPPATNLEQIRAPREVFDDIPVWIDRAIVIVVMLLVALILRAVLN